MEYLVVFPDEENNAEDWWIVLRTKFPQFATTLEKEGGAVIAKKLWDVLAALPGFGKGPHYARYALLRRPYKDHHHQKFEILS